MKTRTKNVNHEFSKQKTKSNKWKKNQKYNFTSFREPPQSYKKYPNYHKKFPSINRRNTGKINNFNNGYNKNKYSFQAKPRSVSPILGSEEYMTKKIQETSAIIMKQLLNPDDQLEVNVKQSTTLTADKSSTSTLTENETAESSSSVNNCNKNKVKKASADAIDDIHERIMAHITKLNDGKKKNLINCHMSGYDSVIELIQKQKRLEISQALRAMCSRSEETREPADIINLIIPDIGIKIEDLPQEFIDELRNTLNDTSDWGNALFCTSSDEILETSKVDISRIKSEKLEDDENLPAINDSNDQNVGNSFDSMNIKKESPDPLTEIEDSCLKDDSKMSCASDVVIKQEIWEQSTSDIDETMNELKYSLQDIRDNEADMNKIWEQSTSDIDETMNELKYSMQDIRDNEADMNSSTGRTGTDVGKEIEDNNGASEGDKTRESEFKSMTSTSTQTDEEWEYNSSERMIDCLLAKCHRHAPQNITEAVDRMLEIDNYILKLTNYRRSLFTFLGSNDKNGDSKTSPLRMDDVYTKCSGQNDTGHIIYPSRKRKKNSRKSSHNKKRKAPQKSVESTSKAVADKNSSKSSLASDGKIDLADNVDILKESGFEEDRQENVNSCSIKSGETDRLRGSVKESKERTTPKYLQLPNFQEKVMVIKIATDKVIAGTESGKVLICSLEDGRHIKTLNISQGPVTSIILAKHNDDATYMYVGSFHKILKVYGLADYNFVKNIPLGDSCQCMEYKWDFIFIGCSGGLLAWYSLKKNTVVYEDKLCDSSILVLKAAQEGARKILVVGSDKSPVCIRDAMTGLYMRTVENTSATVYSLILDKNLLYCGTTKEILVYSFHDGKLIHRHESFSSKAVGCVDIDSNLLFVSCFDGHIYVYDTKNNSLIGSIFGPGGGILSMEVFGNQIIVGTACLRFKSVPIPRRILRHRTSPSAGGIVSL